MHISTVFLVPFVLQQCWALPRTQNSRHRHGRRDDPTLNQFRSDAVKEAFQHAWDGYYKYAFPHDELHPVTNTSGDSRNAWGASAVDAFSTAIVMENQEVVDIILDYIPTIDFSYTATQVSLFETTIRYLGGILSGYDLLTGPLSSLASNSTAVDALLTQAISLADNLAFAFDTPTGIPSNNLYFTNHTTDGASDNGLATIGSLVLEWSHLSDLTGNDTYANLSQKGESYLLDPHPASSEPFPGLVGTDVNLATGLFEDAEGGWVGGDDSFYEYLIKMYVYDSDRFGAYKDRWITAADSTIKYLASHPSTRPDLTFVAMFDGTELIYTSEHLACFAGGNFLLAGAVLDEQKYIDFGVDLVAGCEDTYNSTLTGIGPEIFKWLPQNVTNTSSIPSSQQALYDKAGFWITDGNYILRPEVIESFYYAYRITGDQIYRDWAWNAFVAINATARTASGFAELNNVNEALGGGFMDMQDSFLFAEVLKYSYLIHTEDAEWQVSNGENQFVFNTEAHPFKVRGPAI